MQYRMKGSKGTYSFVDARCIGRECWQPGTFQSRGATLSGSRNTGEETLCCMRRAYHGCPDGPDGEKTGTDVGGQVIVYAGLPIYSEDLAKKRKAEGWR